MMGLVTFQKGLHEEGTIQGPPLMGTEDYTLTVDIQPPEV